MAKSIFNYLDSGNSDDKVENSKILILNSILFFGVLVGFFLIVLEAVQLYFEKIELNVFISELIVYAIASVFLVSKGGFRLKIYFMPILILMFGFFLILNFGKGSGGVFWLMLVPILFSLYLKLKYTVMLTFLSIALYIIGIFLNESSLHELTFENVIILSSYTLTKIFVLVSIIYAITKLLQIYSKTNKELSETNINLSNTKSKLETLLKYSQVGFAILDKKLNKDTANDNYNDMIGDEIEKVLESQETKTSRYFNLDNNDNIKYYELELNKKYLAVIVKEVILEDSKLFFVVVNDLSPYFANSSLLEELVDERTKELREEISNREIIEQQLKHTKKELTENLEHEKEISAMKSSFVSMITHEYRTPLSIILTSTELLELYIKKNTLEKSKNQFNRIKTSIDNLTKLVNDVVEFNRSDSESTEINKEKIQLSSYLNDFILQISIIDNHKHKFELNYDTDIVSFNTDERFLNQILSKIIYNSINYSDDGTIIKIHVASDNNSINISISDSGQGISEKDLKNLFIPFYKKNEQIGIKSGTGLGLSIAKNYVEKLNGKIIVSSESGKGTTFIIQLPQ